MKRIREKVVYKKEFIPNFVMSGHPRQMTLSELIDRDMKSMVDRKTSANDCRGDCSTEKVQEGIKDSLNELYQQLQSKLQPIPMKVASKHPPVLPKNPHQIAIPSQGHLIVSRDLKMVKTDKNLMKEERRERCEISKSISNFNFSRKQWKNHEKPYDTLRKTINQIGEKIRPTKYLESGKYEQIRVWLIQSLHGASETHSQKEVESTHVIPVRDSSKVTGVGTNANQKAHIPHLTSERKNGSTSEKTSKYIKDGKMNVDVINEMETQSITRKRKLHSVDCVDYERRKKLAKLDDLPCTLQQENDEENCHGDDDIDFKIESSVFDNFL